MQMFKAAALTVAFMGFAMVAAADPKPAAQATTDQPAIAQPAPPPPPQEPAKVVTATDAEKKICRKYKSTGSRLADRRVCKTAAEWRDDNIEIRKQLNNHNRQTTNGG